MARERTKREKRLRQLMMLITGCIISVFLNGFLAIGHYLQYQNVGLMKQTIGDHEVLIDQLQDQNALYVERFEEMTETIRQLQKEVETLQSHQVPVSTPITGRKVAYLTFDDGPTDLTPKVLDVLKENDVKATFFVVGNNVKRYPEIAKRIVEEGHTIGNHSHTHRYEKLYTSLDALKAEINYCNDEIYKATGMTAQVFRFPGGSSNSLFHNYAPEVPLNSWLSLIHEMGMEYHDWNVSSLDASSKAVTSKEIVNAVVSGAKSKSQVNVLMHDVNKNQATLEALPEIIRKLKEMGFSIEAITSKSSPIQHKIAE